MSFYEHYAKRAKHPAGVWVHRLQARRLAELAASSFSKTNLLLEIGPGEGFFAEECSRAGVPYLGLEASPELVTEQRRKGLNVQPAVVPPIPLASASTAACCLFHVLEHLPNAEKARYLISETRRVLIEDGVLILACPNYYTWGRDFFEDDYTHNYITTPRRVRQLLTDSGYEIEQVEFYSGPVFGFSRYFLLLANRLLYWRWLNRIIGSARYYQGFLTFLECFVVVARAVEPQTASMAAD